VALLGATGSIGRQTLELLRQRRDRFRLVLLTGRTSGAELAAAASEFEVPCVQVEGEAGARAFRADPPPGTELLVGAGSLAGAIGRLAPDLVVNGITGSAGLPPTLAAIRAGADLALANKESLVMAGSLVRRELAQSGSRLLPVDSEHAAIHQCLKGEDPAAVRRIYLTASGGALRDLTPGEIARVGPERVLEHPTWSMGPRITVGSATMMNKAFEIIEAHWLFDLPADRIEVLLHRQSIVHSMVEFRDGNILAQLGVPDMKVPILAALGDGERLPYEAEPFDLAAFRELTFAAPDPERYPALALAYRVLAAGGDAGAVLNAADEVATEAFLAGRLPFPGIVDLVGRVLAEHEPVEPDSLDRVLAADAWARMRAERFLERA